MEERQPVALDALENEPLAAKESGPDTLRKRDRDVRAARRHEERILLRDDRPAPITQIDWTDLAREVRRKRDVLSVIGRVGERGDEEGVA